MRPVRPAAVAVAGTAGCPEQAASEMIHRSEMNGMDERIGGRWDHLTQLTNQIIHLPLDGGQGDIRAGYIEVWNMPVFDPVNPRWKTLGDPRAVFHLIQGNDAVCLCQFPFC